MRLYEHEAKTVLAGCGFTIPARFGVIRSLAELEACRVTFPAMVKAQVLIGGRGKAGGIRRVETPDAARRAVTEILGTKLRGHPVESALIEDVTESTGSLYLGVTPDPATGNSVIIGCAVGGVDIEELARRETAAVRRWELTGNPAELPVDEARRFAGALLAPGAGADGAIETLADLVGRLYRAYQRHDCTVAEINPLLRTDQGFVAVDGKIVLDGNALYRQGALLESLGIQAKRHQVAEPTARDRRAAAAGIPYVDLLPESTEPEPGKIYVGLVAGGAGYGIFSIDEVTNVGARHFDGRLVPVNFMDSGGGPSRATVKEMFALLMDHPLVDLIVTSRFGGISSCDVFIRGLVDCLRERAARSERVVPVHGRMVGTDLAAGRAFLESARRETPGVLEALSMVVGNRKIMVDVIRDAVADFIAGRETR